MPRRDFGLAQLVSLLLARRALRASGPALTCNVLRLEAAFVGMNHQVQIPWTEGRAVGSRGETSGEDSVL